MRTVETKAHAGCSWIVDQLIGIRDLEQQLIAALASRDQTSRQLRSRLAELDRWVEMLDHALDASSSAAEQDRVVRRRTRCICLSHGNSSHAGFSPHRSRRGSPLQRTA
jgi:hypothetical protein